MPKQQHRSQQTIQRIKEEGWVGKPKGLMQVVWERDGSIQRMLLDKHTLHGPQKDSFGNTCLSTSLIHLMSMCPDFLNKQGMMEHICEKLGLKVIQNSTFTAHVPV